MISRLNRRRLVRLVHSRTSKMSDPTDRWSSNYDENESCGASSTFVRISENWGFKYARYSCRKMAANTFKSQRKAWRVGAGPFCFGLIQVKIQGTLSHLINSLRNLNRLDITSMIHTAAISHARFERNISFV
jgi:hypothetical protein